MLTLYVWYMQLSQHTPCPPAHTVWHFGSHYYNLKAAVEKFTMSHLPPLPGMTTTGDPCEHVSRDGCHVNKNLNCLRLCFWSWIYMQIHLTPLSQSLYEFSCLKRACCAVKCLEHHILQLWTHYVFWWGSTTSLTEQKFNCFDLIFVGQVKYLQQWFLIQTEKYEPRSHTASQQWFKTCSCAVFYQVQGLWGVHASICHSGLKWQKWGWHSVVSPRYSVSLKDEPTLLTLSQPSCTKCCTKLEFLISSFKSGIFAF